ncbi:unnamed protein product, partial [Mesorhabditis spiculigera]
MSARQIFLLVVMVACLIPQVEAVRGALIREGRSAPGYVSQDFLRFGRSAAVDADTRTNFYRQGWRYVRPNIFFPDTEWSY